MNFILNFDARIATDTKRIYEYYNDLHLPDTADLFLTQVDKTYDLLEKNPFLFRVFYNNIHCAVLKKFPFLVHYQINKANHTVLVLAIHPASSKPLWEY